MKQLIHKPISLSVISSHCGVEVTVLSTNKQLSLSRRDEVDHCVRCREPLSLPLLRVCSMGYNRGSYTVFIDQVDDHVVKNIQDCRFLILGKKVTGEIADIQKRSHHLHWRIPARLPPWTVSELTQMQSISKLLIESCDDIIHDCHTC